MSLQSDNQLPYFFVFISPSQIRIPLFLSLVSFFVLHIQVDRQTDALNLISTHTVAVVRGNVSISWL